MIGGTCAVLYPVVDMQMFNLCTRLELGANKGVVELFGIHIEHVSIAFCRRNTGRFVDVLEVGDEGIVDHKSLSDFIEIARRDC